MKTWYTSCALTVFILLCKFCKHFLENVEKKFIVGGGGGLERVGRVTAASTILFFRLIIFNKANHPKFKVPKLLVKILFKIIV